MQSLKITIVIILLNFQFINSQSFKISGRVLDEHSHVLTGATVRVIHSELGTSTDKDGLFEINFQTAGFKILEYKFLGYSTSYDTLNIGSDLVLTKVLNVLSRELNELTVTEKYQSERILGALNVKVLDQSYLQTQNAGSLMQSLSRLPGVGSMDIGSGQSKPQLRGLGFNRVVVAENGIKHQGQEWGVDHGLEIDQNSIDKAEIIKGPASLIYGSDAIGGVINLKQQNSFLKNSNGGNVLFTSNSINNLYGFAGRYFIRWDKVFLRFQGSYSDFSDYMVPVDSIIYMTYNIRLKNKRLRNTAGLKRNGGIVFGYQTDNFKTNLTLTDNFEKSGFFANAHGLEIRNSEIDYDSQISDIDLPYQQVNHLKFLNQSSWSILDYKLSMDLGYQNNFRQEFSEAVAHGYMPQPTDTLERLFNKDTYTASLKLDLPKHHINQLSLGANFEYQNNESGGWGFILPDFRLSSFGTFLFDNIYFTEEFQMNLGVRFDLGNLQTSKYTDWFTTPVNGEELYISRAEELNKWFGNLSWAIGLKQKTDDFVYKINLGKSFRMPTAKELASNGINYHMFRYEKGDKNLNSEQSYQIDFSTEYFGDKWSFEINPFINYFPNYIYLNPTAKLTDSQQLFIYSQSEVFRTGGELNFNVQITKQIEFNSDLEYVFSRQLSGDKKGYTLPFSPPLSSNYELIFKDLNYGVFENTRLSLLARIVAAQNDIVPPEKKTQGYFSLSLNAYSDVEIFDKNINFSIKINNLLNDKYFDHTSFYRLIEVPSPGRNIQLTINYLIN